MFQDNAEYFNIGIGMWSHYYTLRLNYMEKVFVPSSGAYGNATVNGVYQGTTQYRWKSHHVKNLSQNYNEAITKARAYAANHQKTLNEDVGEWDLNEIRRRNASQVFEDRWLKWERIDGHQFTYDDPRGLVFYFGKYRGENVYDVLKKDQGYLEFLAKNSTNESILVLRIQTILERVPALPKVTSNHVGALKERITITAKLEMAKHIDSMWGTSELLKFRDKKGNLFVTFYTGYKFGLDIGATVTLKGTVKKHDEYNDEKQTMINRIKIVN